MRKLPEARAMRCLAAKVVGPCPELAGQARSPRQVLIIPLEIFAGFRQNPMRFERTPHLPSSVGHGLL
jgi:hypothetical protein